MDIAGAIVGINAAIETVRALKTIDKAYDQAVLKGKVSELMEQLSDAKMALVCARDEIWQRDQDIEELRNKLKRQASLVKAEGQTYESKDGKPIGVPFCSACLVNDGTQIRYNNTLDEFWKCPRCKATAAGLKIFR